MKSQAQRRYLWAKHPDVAEEFEEETPRGKRLPKRVRPKREKATRGRRKPE